MSNFKTTLDHFELPADSKADNYPVIQRRNKGLYNLFVLIVFVWFKGNVIEWGSNRMDNSNRMGK